MVYDSGVFHTGAVVFLYLLSILGWGELVCTLLSRWERDFSDYIVSRLLLGCFGLYAAFILLSTVGVLQRMPVALTLACGLVFSLVRLRVVGSKLHEAVREIFHWPFGLRVLLGIICVLAILQIACGFTPLILYDSQIYHLLAPVQFLKAGSLVHIPWNVLANGPMALQLTFGMSWIADPSGNSFKLLMTVFGCLLLLAAAKIGADHGLQASLLASLFVACYPELWLNQALGVVDLATAAFFLFGVFWWREALRQQSWSWTFQSAIAFGFVLASRYQGILLVGLGIVAVLIDESSRNRKATLQNLLKASAAAVVIAAMVAPWLIRNYSNFGNPVYPLLHGWLGGIEWSAAQAARFQREVFGPSLQDVSTLQKVMAPISALLMVPSNGLFGLGLLLGSLVAFGGNSHSLRVYAALGIGGLVMWGLIHPTTGVNLLRFNAAGLVLMLSCTGAILGSDRLREWKGLSVGATVALGSLIIGLVALQGIVPVWQTLTDGPARTLFWRANVPSWAAFEFANAKLDRSRHKILLIGETRALWLEIPFLAPTAFNGPQLDEVFRSNAEPAAWLTRLNQLKVTHLLISFPEWQRFQKRFGYFNPPPSFNLWLQGLPVLFDDKRGTVLLSLPGTASGSEWHLFGDLQAVGLQCDEFPGMICKDAHRADVQGGKDLGADTVLALLAT